MKKLRIAQVTNLQQAVPPKHQNGLEQLVFDLTEELVELGHDVTLFATADSKTSAKLVPIWPHAVNNQGPYDQLLEKETFAIWSVAEALSRHQDFDIIHSHDGLVGKHFAGITPVPLVSTTHSPVSSNFIDQFPPEYQQYFHEIEQKHFKKAHTVAVSENQARGFTYPVRVIHNGIRLSNWPNHSNEPGDYFAFLGYITQNKGVAEAIQAILPTNERLLIAGRLDSSPKNQEYFKKSIEPFLSDRIKFVGPLEFEEKQDFLLHAKALLMPIQWEEPFGLVAIEALATGTPVIGWDRGATREIIEDGISGYLVNSIPDLTLKINDVKKLDRNACRQRVESHFSATLMAKRYEEFYYSLIK